MKQGHIKVIFGRSNSNIGKIIRFVSRSDYSHIAYIDEQTGYIIEAAGGIGVRITNFESFSKKYPIYLIAEIPVHDPHAFRRSIIRYVGSGYDFNAILGILLRVDWNEDANWTCSELIAKCSGLFREDKLHRVTQEHLYVLSKDSFFDFSKYDTSKIPTKDELFNMWTVVE